nr:KUP/HAK/KT family potassium transporter [Frondihabitans sp. PAMC 28766]
MLLLVSRQLWHWRLWKTILAAVVFGGLELTFLAGNLSKIVHGGWVPLLIALSVITVMTTWRRGRQLVQDQREELEGPLEDFIEQVNTTRVPRVQGVAIFPHPNKDTTPLALRANVEHNHVMHDRVIIVSVHTANVPHVPHSKAFTRDDLGYTDDGIEHVTVKFGFSDDQDLPFALHAACLSEVLDVEPDAMDDASYFISRGGLRLTRGSHGMVAWRKKLFVALAHNAADPAARFMLPPGRTVTMGNDVEI